VALVTSAVAYVAISSFIKLKSARTGCPAEGIVAAVMAILPIAVVIAIPSAALILSGLPAVRVIVSPDKSGLYSRRVSSSLSAVINAAISAAVILLF